MAKRKRTTKKRSSNTKRSPRILAKVVDSAADSHKEPQTARSVLAMRFVSYATPLEVARRWLKSDDAQKRQESCKLLEGLFQRFGHSLEIGDQLALAYLESKREVEAQAVLDKLAFLCRNQNEEVLSRRGRFYRDQGDRYIEYPEIGGKVESPTDALRFFRRALDQYEAAYQIRAGHYPAINVAALHHLIAACEPDEGKRKEHLAKCQTVVEDLLARRTSWPAEMYDDEIWHAATAGEAHLLSKKWDEAAKCYQAAQQHREFQGFHRNSMRKGVIRTVHGYRQMGVTELGPFKNLDSVFPP
ncbi:hypothetical protein OAS39_09260 [Pirellulales bacterium]|nr:hypothetical protein [Pirellulales bacterium]